MDGPRSTLKKARALRDDLFLNMRENHRKTIGTYGMREIPPFNTIIRYLFCFLWWALDFILDCQSWSTPCFSRIAVNRVRLFPIAPWKWLHLMIFTNLHFPMVFLWFSHSNLHFPMVFLWFSHSNLHFPMVFLWFSHSNLHFPMVFLWFSHSNLHFPMVFLWFAFKPPFSYGFPMVFDSNLHFPMVFLWFSHSNLHFPMVFLWFRNQKTIENFGLGR